MRIQDKNSKLSSGGESTTIKAVSTIHDCAESGDLIGLQRFLAFDPSLLNKTTNIAPLKEKEIKEERMYERK
ncbi:hypothetical protein ACS0TY_025582 [Phlomoides rotata]